MVLHKNSIMRRRLITLLLLPILVSNYTVAQNENASKKIYEVYFAPIDSLEAKRTSLWLEEGRQNVLRFFGEDYSKHFDVYLFSDRDSLDKQWQKDWNMPEFKSQCWMVASGIGHRLDVLSPRVWELQACEHDILDTAATKKIVIHEMIHVFHGQHNPSPTFENIDNIDWFVEGIAVYASGQLDTERYRNARNFIITNGGPDVLSDIWMGENKYGLAGSIVQYIDDNYGRSTLTYLLGLTTADQILKYLKMSEEELISNWKKSIRENESVHNKK
jgi:hypothetical protein